VERNKQIDAALKELRKNPKLSVSQAAKDAGVIRRTLQDHWTREKDGIQATDLPDGGREVVGTGVAGELLVKAGLDPAEWQVTEVKATGDPTAETAKLAIKAVPSDLLDLAATAYAPLPPPQTPDTATRSLAFCGDHHAPHQDPGLHAAFCSFLSDERPSFLGVLGDVGDYASVSRHRAGPGFRQGVKACNQGAYSILYDYRKASPDTQIVLLPGNHDARIEFYIQDRAPEFLEVGPAFQEDVPSYDLRRLWRLDELGVELVDGTWETASYKVTPSLTMRHGYMVAKNNGEGMLNKHGRSAIQGHDHRLRATYKTKHDPLDVRLAISAGTMAIVDSDGLGYAPEPDWQQGCVMGHAWEDGDFALSPVPYVHGKLLTPDGRRF
jgi:hypothetical protein